MKSAAELQKRMQQLAQKRKELIVIRDKLTSALSAIDNHLIDNRTKIQIVAGSLSEALAREAEQPTTNTETA